MSGDTSRVRHGGSATPTGIPEQAHGAMVFLESGFPPETLRKRESLGQKLGKATGSYGGYQGILINHEQGTLHGATEARKDGVAVGY